MAELCADASAGLEVCVKLEPRGRNWFRGSSDRPRRGSACAPLGEETAGTGEAAAKQRAQGKGGGRTLPATTAPGVGHGERYQDMQNNPLAKAKLVLYVQICLHTPLVSRPQPFFCPPGCQTSLRCPRLLRSNMWHNQVQGSTLHQTLGKKHPGPSSLAQELTTAMETVRKEFATSLIKRPSHCHFTHSGISWLLRSGRQSAASTERTSCLLAASS